MQAFDFSDKVSVITGAGSGIGKSIATVFSKHGSKVYILDVDETSAQETERQILDEGGQAVFIHCDVARQEEVKRIQSVPLLIGQFLEPIDQNYAIVSSTTGFNQCHSAIRRHKSLRPSAIDARSRKIESWLLCRTAQILERSRTNSAA